MSSLLAFFRVNWLPLAIVVAMTGNAIWFYNKGQANIEAKWNESKLVIAETERLAKIEADAKADALSAAQRALEAELETAHAERNQLRDDNAQLQNRTPIVRTVQVPVEGVCHYPDVAQFVRVWNADARGESVGALSASREAGVSKLRFTSDPFDTGAREFRELGQGTMARLLRRAANSE